MRIKMISPNDKLAQKILNFIEIVSELTAFAFHLFCLFLVWIAPLILWLIGMFIIVGIPLILMLNCEG